MLTFGSLFAGIGGFDLGLEWAGMKPLWQVEIDDFATSVLEKHWPHVARYRDVRECGDRNLDPVDVVCGGFPCQPFSIAGLQAGEQDSRNLWPEMHRIVKELKPRWVIGENVAVIANQYLDTVCTNLEDIGYTTWPSLIPACAFGLPQIRERVFILAHANDIGRNPITDRNSFFGEARRGEFYAGVWPGRISRAGGARFRAIPDAGIHRNFDGLSGRMDQSRPDRYRALGNAVVPQAAEFFGRLIVEYESSITSGPATR